MTQFVSVTLATVILRIFCGIESVLLLSPLDGVQEEFQSPDILDEGNFESFHVPSLDNVRSDLFLIKKFVFKFTNAILSSDRLSEIYVTSLSPEKAERAFDKIVYVAVDNVHTQYPQALAQVSSSAIRATYSNLTLTKNVQVWGYTAAKYLISKNVLTWENLYKLVDAYVFYVKQAVGKVPKIPDPRDAYIQASMDGFVHFMTSLGLQTAEGVPRIAHYFIDSLHSLTGVQVPPPEDPCCESNLIEKFVSKYIRVVLASKRISEIYDTSLSPKEAAATYYRVVYDACVKVRAPFPKADAQVVSDAVLKTIAKFSSAQNAEVGVHAAAVHLKSLGVLTCENLDELSDVYIFYVKQEVRNVPNIPDRRHAFIQAISDIYAHFMTSLNIYRIDSVQTLAQTHAQSFYVLSGVVPDNPSSLAIDERAWPDKFVKFTSALRSP